MKPYYEHAGIKIYHGDCRDILPQLPKVDLVLTDPPYGVGMVAFNDDFTVSSDAFALIDAHLAAVFMSPRRILDALVNFQAWTFERCLWMHKTADIAAPWHGWCMNSEAILILSRDCARWPKQSTYRSDVYSVGPWERSGHPNGKPLEVVVDLARRMSIESSAIIDPFMGSGTTLVAAKLLGRRAIGIEIEERYCEIAAKRLQQEVFEFSAPQPQPEQQTLCV